MTPTFRRRNPLTGDFVLVSPIRMQRPWSQETHDIVEDDLPEYDPNCNLCPGNTRASGVTNEPYTNTFCFLNDYPSLSSMDTEVLPDINVIGDLYTQQPERGRCEVLCFTPSHNTNLTKMRSEQIAEVVQVWKQRYQALSAMPQIKHIQIFETRGKEVGNSAPHPHCQIWAQESIPSLPARIYQAQELYMQKHLSRLLLDYAQQELQQKERVIYQTGDFMLAVPYWAEWPYELYILPTVPLAGLHELSSQQMVDLAQMLWVTTRLYAQFFGRPKNGAPYMMTFSQQPTATYQSDAIQFFVKFLCPLLTPTRQKYQAGYEKSAEPQRDITPEKAAEQLRGCLGKSE